MPSARNFFRMAARGRTPRRLFGSRLGFSLLCHTTLAVTHHSQEESVTASINLRSARSMPSACRPTALGDRRPTGGASPSATPPGRPRLFLPRRRAPPLLGRGGVCSCRRKSFTTPGSRSATAQSLASLTAIVGESDGGVKGLSSQRRIQDHSQPHASATKLLIHDGQGFGLVTIGQSSAVRQLPIDHVRRNTIAFVCP